MSMKKTAWATSCIMGALLFPMEAYSGADWSQFGPDACVHWVRPGENLTTIARGYDVELQDLANLNQMDTRAQLFAGQAISLPGSVTRCEQTLPQIQAMITPEPDEPDEPDVDYNYAVNHPDKDQSKEVKWVKKDPPGDFVCSNDELFSHRASSKDYVHLPGEHDPSPAESAFGERPYSYYGSSESLGETLRNFAASYYIPLILAEDVSGEVNGKIGPLTPVDFLDHMSNIYGFIWYFDGHTLYVYNARASQQQILSLNYLSADELKETLKKVGVWDNRFFWKSQPEEGLIFVSGPPRYVELVTQTAMLLDEKEGMRQKSKLTVCTFTLKYAWATDKSYNFRGEQVTVPGVATILQNIIRGGGVSQLANQETYIPSVTPATRISRSTKDTTPEKLDTPKEPLNEGAVAETVFINADPRQNAVIVHDLESKMRMYSTLVKSLDKPTAQIEISVSIIDVNTARLDALGVEYNNIRGDNGAREIEFNPIPESGGPAFTTIISSRISSFNATISLLQEQGEARIVSRPSILTLDNLEAVLDNTSTSYVKVEANQDAQLFPVTSGTVVQVTPRVVREEDSRKIHMSISIEDGKDANSDPTLLPTVSKSSLNTQAVVHESESLLIGGFYKEETENTSTQVPLLGDIPILGQLFRMDNEKKSKRVRMFLITPRIIELKRT